MTLWTFMQSVLLTTNAFAILNEAGPGRYRSPLHRIPPYQLNKRGFKMRFDMSGEPRTGRRAIY